MTIWGNINFQDRASPIIEQLIYFHDHALITIVMIFTVVSYIIIILISTFFPFTIPSRSSFSRQFLLSQWPSQFLFLFFISSSIILPFPTLSSTTAFFILSVHFTRSILLHAHKVRPTYKCWIKSIVTARYFWLYLQRYNIYAPPV